MHQSHWMDFDIVRDNKLQPCKPDSVVWDHGKAKGLIRISKVHHNCGFRAFCIFKAQCIFVEGKNSFVHKSIFTFRTAYGNFPTCLENFCCVACSHNCWNSQFPADNCSMRGSSSLVRDNCSCSFHYRLPVRGCGISNQNLSLFKRRQI